MDRDDKFIKGLKNRLDDAEVKAPEGLFDSIGAEMEARGLVPAVPASPRSGKVRRLLWIPAVAAAVVAGVFLFLREPAKMGSFQSGPVVPEPDVPSSAIAVVEDTVRTSEVVLLADNRFPEAEPSELTDLPGAVQKVQPEVEPEVQTEVLSEVEPEVQTEVLSEVEPEIEPEVLPEAQPEVEPEAQPEPETFVPLDDFGFPEEVDEAGKAKKVRRRGAVRYDTDIRYSGNLFASSFGQKDAIFDTEPGQPLNQYPSYEIVHSQPLKFAVTAGFNITDWFRISTGISYSYLHSKINFEFKGTDIRGSQHLHYMGIPVNLQFRLFHVKFFSGYFTAGAAMEGLVSGKQQLYSSISDRNRPSVIRLKDHLPVFSVNAALGFNFKLGGPVNLYLEPGVAYYFGNDSDMESAYHDRPLNLGINIGLRFDL